MNTSLQPQYLATLFVAAALSFGIPRMVLADPSPSPQASCQPGDLDQAARLLTRSPLSPPNEETTFKGKVTVEVAVEISSKGAVTHAVIVKSSHDGALDHSALDAAIDSKYAPAIVDCKPIAGHYTFQASFETGI